MKNTNFYTKRVFTTINR